MNLMFDVEITISSSISVTCSTFPGVGGLPAPVCPYWKPMYRLHVLKVFEIPKPDYII